MSAVLGQSGELATKSLRHRPLDLETHRPNGQICTPNGPGVGLIPIRALVFIGRFLRRLPKRAAPQKTRRRSGRMSSRGGLGLAGPVSHVPVPLSERASFRMGLVWAMGLLLGAAVIGSLALHGDSRTSVVDGLGLLAVWISAWGCWVAVLPVG